MKGMLNSFHLSYQTSSETVTFDFKSACVLFWDSGEYSGIFTVIFTVNVSGNFMSYERAVRIQDQSSRFYSEYSPESQNRTQALLKLMMTVAECV